MSKQYYKDPKCATCGDPIPQVVVNIREADCEDCSVKKCRAENGLRELIAGFAKCTGMSLDGTPCNQSFYTEDKVNNRLCRPCQHRMDQEGKYVRYEGGQEVSA